MEQLEKFKVQGSKFKVQSSEIQIQSDRIAGSDTIASQIEWMQLLEYQRMMTISVFKKVKLTLSRSQLECLRTLMQIYLTIGELNSIWQKASQMMAFVFYEKLNKRYLKTFAKEYQFKLDMAEAAMLFDITEELSCSGLGEYEENVMRFICGEIHQQTI